MEITQTIDEQAEMEKELWEWNVAKELQRGQPRHSEAKWLTIFPEAKNRWGKIIIAIEKLKIKYYTNEVEVAKKRTIKELRENDPQTAWRDDLIKDRGREKIKIINHEIAGATNRIKIIRTIGRRTSKGRQKDIVITEEMVEKAKDYPLHELVEVNRSGFTKCWNHDDAHASLYVKNGFVYCFSCQYSADSIKILMDRDGLKFKDAVLKLQ